MTVSTLSSGDLLFLTGFRRDLAPLRCLEGFANHSVPKSPGVYFLLAKPRYRFPYPKGKRSTVFYIGQAKNLWRRLKDHQKYICEAKQKRNRSLVRYYRRYEYAAAFGERYCFVRAKGCSPRALERRILLLFAERYGCCPIANGAEVWERRRRR